MSAKGDLLRHFSRGRIQNYGTRRSSPALPTDLQGLRLSLDCDPCAEAKRMRQPVLRQRGVENPREVLVATREPVIDPFKECAKWGGLGFPNGQSRSAVQLTPRV